MARFKDTTVESLQFGDNVADGNLIDSLNNAGTDGQVLVSTGTGFEWRTVGTQEQSRFITVTGNINYQQLPSQGIINDPQLATMTTISLNQISESSGDFNVLVGGGIQVNQNAIYLATYSAQVRGIASNTFDQQCATFQLAVNGIYVTGSRTYCSCNTVPGGAGQSGQGIASKTIPLNLSAGDAVTLLGADSTSFNSPFGFVGCITPQSTLTLFGFI